MDRIIQGEKFDTPLNRIVSTKRMRKRSISLLPDIPTLPATSSHDHLQHCYSTCHPNMSYSFASRAALPALRNSGKSISASTQRLSGKSLFSGTCLKGSHWTASRHGNAHPRTPFSVSSVPASDGNRSAAQGSAMSYKGSLNQADLGPTLRVLDWADSTYGMGELSGPHTSFARTASAGGSSKATAPLIADSLDIPQGTNLDPPKSLPPDGEETPPSSIEDPLKPPQPSIAISSVGSDGSRETHLFELGGRPVFAELFKIGRRGNPK
jgi:hypothetical protein